MRVCVSIQEQPQFIYLNSTDSWRLNISVVPRREAEIEFRIAWILNSIWIWLDGDERAARGKHSLQSWLKTRNKKAFKMIFWRQKHFNSKTTTRGLILSVFSLLKKQVWPWLYSGKSWANYVQTKQKLRSFFSWWFALSYFLTIK